MRATADDAGFSIVELLVVVVVLGIIAMISIPTFVSQRNRGWETQALSVARLAQQATESCSIADGPGFTACPGIAELEPHGFAAVDRVSLDYTPTVTTYTIAAQHDYGGDRFTITSAGTLTRGPRQ